MKEFGKSEKTLVQRETACEQKDRLYEKLVHYEHSDYYGFHMPGHKRNTSFLGNGLPYGIDITEIDGFDDLHHAKDLLKEAQERAASVYHAEETYFLINGSTSGLLSAILGCTDRGSRILVARNCHKSVYAAIEMNELQAIYLYPTYEEEKGLNGIISGEAVAQALESDQKEHGKTTIEAVVITSPTYDGVVSYVAEIADIAHRYEIPLIVDEAHGAHLGFHSYFPKNSNQLGADLVIHSLHKTVPSLTQTALIHLNGRIIHREKVRKYIHMLQTSSPSYVLMASMDECIRFLEQSEEEFETYHLRLKDLRQKLTGNENREGLGHLKLVETENYDPSKIIISTRNTRFNGKQLYEILLEKYHLQMEMASQEYILAMTSVCDREEGFARLQSALFELDQQLEDEERKSEARGFGNESESVSTEENLSVKFLHLEQHYTSAAAVKLKEQMECILPEILLGVPFQESVGKVSLEYVYVYPPGIPLIVPGEMISEEAVHLLQEYENMGFDIEGLRKQGYIFVKE